MEGHRCVPEGRREEDARQVVGEHVADDALHAAQRLERGRDPHRDEHPRVDVPHVVEVVEGVDDGPEEVGLRRVALRKGAPLLGKDPHEGPPQLDDESYQPRVPHQLSHLGVAGRRARQRVLEDAEELTLRALAAQRDSHTTSRPMASTPFMDGRQR